MNCFNESPNKWYKIINNKIDRLGEQTYAQLVKHLNDKVVRTSLQDVQTKCVIVVTSKASNNIIIVCKLYYIKTIIDKFIWCYYKQNSS